MNVEWSASSPGRFISGEIPRYPFYRRLDGPKNRHERYGKEKNLLPFRGI
jgi:hypothetical protein